MGRGGRKGKGFPGSSVASQIMPAEESEYYGQLQEKHFSADAVGSRFTADTLQSLLDRNPQLLGGEDDRQAFLQMGVPEEALLPGRSYFLLRAPGQEGMVAAERLAPETPIEIVRAKAGSLSLVVRGQDQTPTQVATAIVGDYPRDPSRRALITVFPGLPADPDRSLVPEENDFGLQDGQKVPLRELQKILGRDDLLLQVSDRPRSAPVIERSDARVLAALQGAPLYQKQGQVQARRVQAGERIETVLAAGTIETERVAKEGDWEITNPSGEKYLVPDEKFQKKYQPSDQEGVYDARGLVRATPNPLGSDVQVRAWGELQYGEADCIFVCAVDESGQDIGEPYIVDRQAFAETYARQES